MLAIGGVYYSSNDVRTVGGKTFGGVPFPIRNNLKEAGINAGVARVANADTLAFEDFVVAAKEAIRRALEEFVRAPYFPVSLAGAHVKFLGQLFDCVGPDPRWVEAADFVADLRGAFVVTVKTGLFFLGQHLIQFGFHDFEIGRHGI